MSGGPIWYGGILAAGAGSRLRDAGWTVPKPMVPVAGAPLIEGVIRNFTAAGIRSLAIILNEQERDCADWVRARFPDLSLRFIVKTTGSSLESFREITRLLGPVRALISTVDAWCPERDFVAFVEGARRFPPDALVLGVTPFVADERPLWAGLDGAGRVTRLGGSAGELVTAGMYLVPERIAALSPPPGLGSLREFLTWLVDRGDPVYGAVIPTVVDVDRPEDVALAEATACRAARDASRKICWGIFREPAHSPGREVDDAEILGLTAKHLERKGFEVALKSPDELSGAIAERPPFVFLMCERLEVLRQLRGWEAAGVRQVNSPVAVLNTYRERMVALFEAAAIPFPASRIVPTAGAEGGWTGPAWVKRADVHNTQDGDVVFADTAGMFREALRGLARRGIPRAVVQEHVEGDLIKFYGVGAWFRWFYHKDQRMAGHPFDPARLMAVAGKAAAVLGLEVFGGDAIAPPQGPLVVIDLNAWPSFALYRDEAAAEIAAYLEARFRGGPAS